MVSILAYSVVAILFNHILMNLGGSDGVASLSIIWYAQGLFGSLFRGYVNGISSVVSYNLGVEISSVFPSYSASAFGYCLHLLPQLPLSAICLVERW